MTTLRNPKRERFAQELAKGKPAHVAHKTAGFCGDRGAASKLQREASIVQRVEEIMLGKAEIEHAAVEKAAAALAIDKQWVLGRLVENVDRAMQAKSALDSEGKPTGEYRYDGSVANKALELLGKELGMFVSRHEVGKPGEFDRMSDGELDAYIAERARAIGSSAEGERASADQGVAGVRRRLN